MVFPTAPAVFVLLTSKLGETVSSTQHWNASQGNQTDAEAAYSKPNSVALLVAVWAVFFLVSVIGNSLVCVVVIKIRKMRNPTNYLLVNLAIADLMMALCTPLSMFDIVKSNNLLGSIGCKLRIYVLDIFYAASTFTLICVALERYYAVCRPTKFRQFRTHLKLMIIGIWILSCIVYSPMLWACTVKETMTGVKRQLSCNCSSKWPRWYHYAIYGMCIVTTLYLLPMVVILGCYIPVIRKMWTPVNVGSNRKASNKRKMVIKTLITVVLVFCILWTPYNVLYVLKKFQVDFRSVYGVLWYGSLGLAFLSNCINPILYTLMNRNFRAALYQLFSKQAKIHRRIESFDDLTSSREFKLKMESSSETSIEKIKGRSGTESTVINGSVGDLSRDSSESKL